MKTLLVSVWFAASARGLFFKNKLTFGGGGLHLGGGFGAVPGGALVPFYPSSLLSADYTYSGALYPAQTSHVHSEGSAKTYEAPMYGSEHPALVGPGKGGIEFTPPVYAPGFNFPIQSERSRKTEAVTSRNPDLFDNSGSSSFANPGAGSFQEVLPANQYAAPGQTSGYVPVDTDQSGYAVRDVDVNQQVDGQGESSRSSSANVFQKANVEQFVNSYPSGSSPFRSFDENNEPSTQTVNTNPSATQTLGAIEQNVNVQQDAHPNQGTARDHGNVDVRNAKVLQSVSSQQLFLPAFGNHAQLIKVNQNANFLQAAPPNLGNMNPNHANAHQTANPPGISNAEHASEAGVEDGLRSKVFLRIDDSDCGADSAYCKNVNDEGFYASTDARGHFYRCSNCTPHFFRCAVGTAYHVPSRACL